MKASHTASIQLIGEKRPRSAFESSSVPGSFWKTETKDEDAKRQLVCCDGLESRNTSCRELLNTRRAPPPTVLMNYCIEYNRTTDREDQVFQWHSVPFM